MKEYYKAYEDRYCTAHQKGVSWASDCCSPIVLETIRKYGIRPEAPMMEIGCGEGRDARAVLEAGYNLTAVDISNEAIEYCRRKMPAYQEHFQVMDCLTEKLDQKFDFMYAVAVLHMLVLEQDRDAFYQFIRQHLKPNGVALICTMGDGKFEMQSDITQAFVPQERNHPSGKMLVAGTSCRMVSFRTFETEIKRNGLELLEKGITSALPDFNSLMYAVVKTI